MEEKVYGVIVETKMEQPLIIEGALMDYDEALTRMRSLAVQPNTIRVAIFKAVYQSGNEIILPKEDI